MSINGLPLRDLLQILADYSGQNAVHYFSLVLLAWAALWLVARLPRGQARPLPASMQGRQLRREFIYSLSTIVLGGAIAPLVLLFGYGPQLNFYGQIDEYGWPWFFFSILLMMFVRDTLFYWEHRLMHMKQVFRFAHRIHHLSNQTTPLSGFSVHPLEGIFAAAIPYTLILFLVPKHPAAYLIFVWADSAVAVLTHMGYEPFPRGFSRHWLGRWIGTSTAHQAHHRNSRCNYALYFLFWDRLMGTLDPEYDARFDIATGVKPRPAPAALPAGPSLR